MDGAGVYFDKATGLPQPGAFAADPFYDSWTAIPNYFKCARPQAQPLLSAAFWVVFEPCAVVLLSLFVGAVTSAMQNSLLAAKDRDERRQMALKVNCPAGLSSRHSRLNHVAVCQYP